MIRAMYSAISGLLNEQLAMDVVGNDIANVNTVGYKSKTTEFEATFAQASIPADNVHPVGISVGLGSAVSAVDTDFSQGSFQRTNVTSNIGISGSGWLKVNSGKGGSGTVYYTRAGNFVEDSSGYLKTPDGDYLQGYGSFSSPNATDVATQASGPLTSNGDVRIPTYLSNGTDPVSAYAIGSDGAITITGQSGTVETIGYLTLTSFPNEQALNYTSNNNYQVTSASGPGTEYRADSGPVGTTQSGVLELSNVDISTEFSNMIFAQRGFDANAKVITTADQMLQTAVNIKQ